MSEEALATISTGFPGAAKATGLSVRTLRYAANDPDPGKRLRTVWYGRRRLIRFSDLQAWLDRNVSDEKPGADKEAA